MHTQAVIDATRRWISSMVIGLNLCPFARRVFEEDRIHYVVTLAEDAKTLLKDLTGELHHLISSPMTQIETMLLIHPHALANFRDYNDFLEGAEQRITELGLDGIVQIAGFHPDYQFAGTEASAVENYTNRSPYPMLHLLREESITALGIDSQELLEIPVRNVATLEGLGREKIQEKLNKIR